MPISNFPRDGRKAPRKDSVLLPCDQCKKTTEHRVQSSGAIYCRVCGKRRRGLR